MAITSILKHSVSNSQSLMLPHQIIIKRTPEQDDIMIESCDDLSQMFSWEVIIITTEEDNADNNKIEVSFRLHQIKSVNIWTSDTSQILSNITER